MKPAALPVLRATRFLDQVRERIRYKHYSLRTEASLHLTATETVGRMRQVMVRGLKRVDQMFVLTMTAYNLTRMRTLGQIRLLAA